MKMPVKWLLTHLLPGVLLCALLGGGAWWLHHQGYTSGFNKAKAAGDTALANERKARADERQELAEKGQQALLDVREREHQEQDRADALAARLADQEQQLQQAQQLLSLNIQKAVSDDNQASRQGSQCDFNGLGPHSLQLYEQALGYTGGGDPGPGDTGGH
ncbi:hypothetical protein CO704_12310 [Cedecea neteri]|uniref:Uncharacterized protein n=3 Tax=Cedecea neteri TaxID=158822 RepID=A0A291E550_9ENTR|nr:hypothetical protein CO704_10035 [Cedecea neteri]ATF95200.1 hypothetical protein CO704_12310 [Cedecea neteri]